MVMAVLLILKKVTLKSCIVAYVWLSFYTLVPVIGQGINPTYAEKDSPGINERLFQLGNAWRFQNSLQSVAYEAGNHPLSLSFTHSATDTQLIYDQYSPSLQMPENPLLIDYRSSSYYTPREVADKMAKVMNRPPPGSLIPVFPLAAMAATLARQYVLVREKSQISGEQYGVDKASQHVLLSLWNKAPQTADQLYKHDRINKMLTRVLLQETLNDFLEKRLIKRKERTNAPTFYYPGQPLDKALEQIAAYLAAQPDTGKHPLLEEIFSAMRDLRDETY